jgi:GrpB-like predicted nucleotidyltransferase (UPF0157 family)
MRKVEVIKYNKKWINSFKTEKIVLNKIFQDNIINIHHIGSTSIPGLSAKPIIDILIEVKDILEVGSKNNEMIKQGYKPYGEYGIKNRRFFSKDRNKKAYHVHIFQEKDNNIIRHLAFRDYLKHNNFRLKEYEKLKINLAKKYSNDIDSYCKGKDSLIKEIEKEALNWYICSCATRHNETVEFYN